MKNMPCSGCGKTQKVGDTTLSVTCCICAMGQMQQRHEEFETRKPQSESVNKPQSAKKKAEIVVESKESDKAVGTINGEQFEANLKMGPDKKLHWIVVNHLELSRGQRIAVARRINSFA